MNSFQVVVLLLSGWLDPVAAQNVAHGLIGHLVPQIGQRSYYPVVTPAGVVACQPNHQILDL